MNELQKAEFHLFQCFASVCEKLHLRYYLVCGSALGAVKYGGFIPWDDDMDVALPRADYEIFLREAPDMLPEYVFLQNARTDPAFPCIFTKLRDKRTGYVEKSMARLPIQHGAYLDVFPLDGYPESRMEAFFLELRKRVYCHQLNTAVDLPRKGKSRLHYGFYRLLGCQRRTAKIAGRYEKMIASYPLEGSRLWCCHGNWQGKLEYAPAEQYGRGVWMEFEGMQVPVPEGYDGYLRRKYGAYTQDPPREEQTGHHHLTEKPWKVMQVNCVYGKGSTGKIVEELHHGLLDCGVESLVCYGRGKQVREAGVWKVSTELYSKANHLLSRFSGQMYGGCRWSTWRLIRRIRREKPDLVHLHCINGYFVNLYDLVRWLKTRGVKTVLTLHAEFPYTANCGYGLDCEKWRTGCGKCPRLRQETESVFLDGTARSFARMQRAFAGFEKDLKVAAVSPWGKRRSEASVILGAMDHCLVGNGVDPEIFSYQEIPRSKEKVILHVTACFSDEPGHLKGGAYVLELAKRMKNVRFLVAGRCALRGPVPENVTLLGNVEDQRLLARYYSRADVTLLTSRAETFSMPCAESLCCGTPVVGFRAGGPESIALEDYSEFVEPGNLDALENAVGRWLMNDELCKPTVSEAARQRYAAGNMTQRYLTLYRGMLDEKG